MSNNPKRPREPMAGGVFIAIGAVGGAIAGGRFGQPVIGFLVGLATGIAISVIIWRMK